MNNYNRHTLYSNIPFRIQIGIIGRRAPSDEKELLKKIREAIKTKIKELFDDKSRALIENSSRTPISYSFITTLSRKADRLIANDVLKIRGSTIEAVLPFVEEDLLKDFKTKEEKEEFEKLIKRARRKIILKRQTLLQEFPDGDFLEGRHQAYENAGRYIVNHSDVIISLQDNKISSKDMTDEIIAYAKAKQVPIIEVSISPPHNISVDPGAGINASSFSEIDYFNSYPIPKKAQKKYIEKINRDYFDFKESKVISEDVRKSILENVLPLYVRTSIIASRNHKFYRYTGFYAHFFAALAVCIVAFGTLFFSGSFVPFVIELGLLLSVFLFVFFANRKKAHEKWIENRFLAERIWSGVFLALCGIEVSSIRVPPHMEAGHKLGDWILMVFDEIWDLLPPLERCTNQYCNYLSSFVAKSWLEAQIKYHKEKARKAEKMNKFLEIGGMAIFVVALIAPLLHLFLFKPVGLFHFFGEGLQHSEKLFEDILIFVALALPAVGAAIVGIRTHMEYSRLAARNENMEIVLKRLDNRLKKAEDAETLELLLREIEELVLVETQDWLTLISFCKPEYVA